MTLPSFQLVAMSYIFMKCQLIPWTMYDIFINSVGGNAIECLSPTQCMNVGQKPIHNCTIVRHCLPPSVGMVIQLCHQPPMSPHASVCLCGGNYCVLGMQC